MRFYFVRKGKRVVYLHPANKGPTVPGSGKSSFASLGKESKIFLIKSFAERKKVVCLQPQKTATFGAEGFIEMVFLGVDRSVKKKL